MIHVSDSEFISAIFGEDAPFAHVTDFPYDPSNIPADRHLSAWKGDWFSRYKFLPQSNRYFTISIFSPDEEGVARRRKALYLRTRCVVLDDVREKLSVDEARKLPEPSWILETSPGSEQWGYIFDTPCVSAARIDNLNDGLIASDLAPSGKDPGQRGVTRYVRLPEGYNNKASKLVDGQPFKCRLLTWNPFNRVTMEQLAAPFQVNLDAVRRDARVDGAADVGDHPLLDIPDTIAVKEVRSDGRFDITCPWVDEHTGADDSGSAVFTNGDGSIGFKCHHGACQTRTGRDLLQLIESRSPGFNAQLNSWKAERAFAGITALASPVPVPAADVPPPALPRGPDAPVADVAPPVGGMSKLIAALRLPNPASEEAREMAAEILKLCDAEPAMAKQHHHDQVRDIMGWSKQDLKGILKDMRAQWYLSAKKSHTFYDDVLFVKELNQFYDHRVSIFFSPESFQNSFMDQDSEARKSALQDGMVTKVDRLDYAPLKPRIFTERGIQYGNTWAAEDSAEGTFGDAAPWLEHFEKMGWDVGIRDHILKFLAFTIRHPDIKINHVLMLGGLEGSGKDFILYPLIEAMGSHSTTISGEELISGFQDYILSTKHLHINEVELGDRREAEAVGAKLKPLAAAPPERLRVNQKNIKPIAVRNILNVTMTTNSQTPLRINGVSRRFFAVWSDLSVRDDYDRMTQDWQDYWQEQWQWMRNGGVDACIWYLKNCVDLTNFVPGQAPPMTEFLREIRESSKSPLLQTVEAFMRRRIGVLRSDLITSADLCSTLKAGEILAQDLMFIDSRHINPARVGTVMKEIPRAYRVYASKGRVNVSLWVIRNHERYRTMTSVQLYETYETQMRAPAAPLTAVN